MVINGLLAFAIFGSLLVAPAAPAAGGEELDDCRCIASEAARKHCSAGAEERGARHSAQEKIAWEEIQRLIDQSIEADIAKDATARAMIETDDFTIRDLDGRVYTGDEAKGIGASAGDYEGILRISEETRIDVECLRLDGLEATVITNQHYVRYLPDRDDGSPHQVITNILHREIWTFTEKGWRVRYVEEIERGPTYLNGEPYDPF